MKILVWQSKHGNVMVAARNEAEEGRAWLYLFKLMEEMGYYCDLKGDELDAYAEAKAGNWRGAMWLLEMRSSGEYETVEVEYVTEP